MADPQALDVEFTDRYGGNHPSRWRYCRGGCEAMGVVPVSVPELDNRPPEPDLAYVERERDPRLVACATAQHVEMGEHECDGWHFVRCPDCGGTGHIAWWRAVRYLPALVWRTVRFVWGHGVHQESRPSHWSRARQWRAVLGIAIGRRTG